MRVTKEPEPKQRVDEFGTEQSDEGFEDVPFVNKLNDKTHIANEFDPISLQVATSDKLNYRNNIQPGLSLNVIGQSDDEKSDGESDSSDDETNDSETSSSSSAKETDLTGDLTDDMCNLSVSEKILYQRSPVFSQTCVRNEPYISAVVGRLHNGGKCVDRSQKASRNILHSDRTFNLNFQLTDSNLQSTEPGLNFPELGFVSLRDLEQFAMKMLNNIDQSNNPEKSNEVTESSKPDSSLLSQTPSDESFYFSPSVIEEREKTYSPKSDDSTYGSQKTSPSHSLSPCSNISSPEPPRYQYSSFIPVCDTNNIYNNLVCKSPKDKQTVKTVPKPIQSIGVKVYENPTSASDRLKVIINTPKLYNTYTPQYIKVCMDFINNPEKLKLSLFNFLKKKRISDDRWLPVLYAHMEYIVRVAKNEVLADLATLQNKEEFAKILTSKQDGQSLLFIACMNHSDLPIAARYITEIMVVLDRNIDEAYNDSDCNSLIHILAEKGDTHVDLLVELMQVKKDNVAAFDINCRNKKSQTPLHLAVINHSANKSCFTTIEHLVKHGAEISQDMDGKTPLHYAVSEACDPAVVRKLLEPLYLNPTKIVDVQDLEGYTALQLAYKKNSTANHQKMKNVIDTLILNKANPKILPYSEMRNPVGLQSFC